METLQELIEAIQSDAAEYACYAKQPDFEITVKITSEDGWCKAELISKHGIIG